MRIHEILNGLSTWAGRKITLRNPIALLAAVGKVLDEVDKGRQDYNVQCQELEELQELHFDLMDKLGGSKTGSPYGRIAALLEKERLVDTWDAMRTGRYDADADLIRKLACVLGTSHLDSAHVIDRANQLKGADMRNRQLNTRVEQLSNRVDELEEYD